MAGEQRERVKQYLLRLIAEDDAAYVGKAQETFSVGKSTVYNYLREMVEEGKIEKNSDRRTGYVLHREITAFTYANTGRLQEDRIFEEDIRPLVKGLPENVYRIWQYAFTEMMNNAIEHSGATVIACGVTQDCRSTTVTIGDNGVGIFRNIQRFLAEKTGEEMPLSDCAAVLLAGKFTTAEQNHSGEGIFFTSHAMDSFAIYSDGVLFTRNNFNETQWKEDRAKPGTAVMMSIVNQSAKQLHEVFDRFSSVEEGFHRTQIPIRHMFSGTEPVSRSEARRLCELVRDFKEISLDFDGVEEIGQAFTHEVFVVWQRNNPEKTIEVVNASERVAGMIARVKKTAGI